MNTLLKKLKYINVLICVAGFGAGLYALILHLQKTMGKENLSCDINNTISCSQVLFSSYGNIFGVPLGAFGMMFFALALMLHAIPKLTQTEESQVSPWSALLGAVGTIAVLILAYISYIKLQAVCFVCATTHILTILYALLSGWCYIAFKNESKRLAKPFSPIPLRKLIPYGLAFGLPPLAVGILAPHVVPLIVKESPSQQTAGSPNPETLGPSFPPELLVISKSQFVGKGEDYRRGNDDAPVVVHSFSDMECPFCKSVDEMFQAVLAEVGPENLLYVFRNFPLSNRCNPEVKSPGHPYACLLAKIARCGGQQGKFWEFKKWAYSLIEVPPREKVGLLSSDAIKGQAIQLGLDSSAFVSCLESPIEDEKIKDDAKIGAALGLEGTPLIVINNRKYDGDYSVKALVRYIKGLLNDSSKSPK